MSKQNNRPSLNKACLCPGDPPALPAEVRGSLQTSKELCCLHCSTEKEYKGEFKGFD